MIHKQTLPLLIKSAFWRGFLLAGFLVCTAALIGLAAINEQGQLIAGGLFLLWSVQLAILPFAGLHKPLVFVIEMLEPSLERRILRGSTSFPHIADMLASYLLLGGGITLSCLFGWLILTKGLS